MKIDVTRKAKIVVVCGSTGSGKSAFVKKEITRSRSRRVLVWDIEDEYTGGEHPVPGFERIDSVARLAEQCGRRKAGRFALVAPKAQFDSFCRVAFAWGGCVAVVEELAGVTNPGKAPEGWHTLVSRGRKRGLDIYGLTQRPSESDKTIFGNASMIHVGRLTRLGDRKYMSSEINVPLSDLTGLDDLEYIQWQPPDKIKRGQLSFKQKSR